MNKIEKKWDKKARNFPRYKETPEPFEAKVLKLIYDNVPLEGLSMLDVGCGSGKFTIHLAKRVKSVTGTDISAEMLKILAEDAEKAGVHNITTVHTSWQDLDLKGDTFDMVFCSTTPAVTTEEDFRKVHEAANRFVVHLCWAGKKDSSIMNPLYAKYGIDFQKINDAAPMKAWLAKENISYKSHVLDDSWERSFPYEEIKRQCIENMESYNADWKEEDIDEVLRRQEVKDGRVIEKTDVLLELIIREK